MPWKTDQYLEKLLPLALLLLLSGRLPRLQEPDSIADRRLETDQPCRSSAVSSWRCLGPGRRNGARRAAARAAEPEPPAWRPATQCPFSLQACRLKTDPYMWSERARGEWERSRRLLHHRGVWFLIDWINQSLGERRIQPPHREGSRQPRRGRD